MKKRSPQIGDRVQVPHGTYEGKYHKGVVDNLLSAQFVYVTDAGQRRMVRYDGLWEFEDTE